MPCGNVALSFLSTRGIQIPTHPCTVSYPFFVTLAMWCRHWYRLSFRSTVRIAEPTHLRQEVQVWLTSSSAMVQGSGQRLWSPSYSPGHQGRLWQGLAWWCIMQLSYLVSPQPLHLSMHLSPWAMFWDLCCSQSSLVIWLSPSWEKHSASLRGLTTD